MHGDPEARRATRVRSESQRGNRTHMSERGAKTSANSGNRPRRRRALAIVAVSFFGIVALAALALLLRPGALHRSVEKALSAVSGLAIEYDRLSLDPGSGVVQFDALRISSGRSSLDIQAEIPQARIHYRFALTDRVLILEQIQLQAPDLRLGPRFDFGPAVVSAPDGRIDPSFQWTVPAVLFSEVHLKILSVSDGRLLLETGAADLRCRRLTLHVRDSGQLKLRTQAAFHWPGGDLNFGDDRIEAEFSRRADGRIAGRIRGADGRLETTGLRAEALSVTLDAVADLHRGDIRLEETRLQGRVAFRSAPAEPVSLTGRGRYRIGANAASVSRWQLGVPDLLEASGDAEWNMDGKRQLTLRVHKAHLAAAAAQNYLATLPGRPRLAFGLSGPLKFEGRVRGAPGTPLKGWQSQSTWTLDRGRIDLGGPPAASGRLTGRLQLSGSLIAPTADFDLTLETETLEAGAVRLDSGRTQIIGNGPWHSPEFSMSGRVEALMLGSGTRYRLQQIQFDGNGGRLALITGSLHLPDLTVTSAEVGRFRGSLTVGDGRMAVRLEAAEAALPRLAKAWGLLPEDWDSRVRDRLRLSFTRHSDGTGVMKTQLEAEDFAFTSPDNSILAENLQISAALDCRFSNAAAKMTVAAQTSAGELLWGRHYLDLAAQPLSIDGKAAYRTDDRSLVFDAWQLALPYQMTIAASGRMQLARQTPAARFNLHMAQTPLAPLFTHGLVEPYRFDHPGLETLEVDGLLSAELTLQHTDGWTVQGRTTLHNGSLQDRARGLALKGIDLDLPIWYAPNPTAADSKPRSGALSISRLSLPLIPPQPLRAVLAVEPGRIRLPEALTVALGTGRVTLGPTVLRRVYGPSPRIKSELRIDNAALDPFLGPLWAGSTGGVLNGRLTEIHYENGRVTSRGTLQARIFGGRIDFSDIALQHPFAAIATLKLDAAIRSLNLAALTAGTDFGKIEGVLEGAVRNLEIVRGQPQRFDLLLETVRRSGIDQSINIRAVENIARIGGGQSPFVGLAGVIGALFDEFQYRKIGVRATLKNDIFYINGTIRENGTEYLVKSGGIPGVDVVNSNPDNRIRFKDMVKRLQRIGSDSASPVIQ